MLRIISRLDRHFPIFSLWSLFWSTYSLISVRRKRFSQNYTEAWRQHYPDHAISVFFDRSSCVRIPCPDPHDPLLDDAWLWDHLAFFYRISQISGGIALVLLPKSLVRLEIVHVSSLLSYYDVDAMNWCGSFSSTVRGGTCVRRDSHNLEHEWVRFNISHETLLTYL